MGINTGKSHGETAVIDGQVLFSRRQRRRLGRRVKGGGDLEAALVDGVETGLVGVTERDAGVVEQRLQSLPDEVVGGLERVWFLAFRWQRGPLELLAFGLGEVFQAHQPIDHDGASGPGTLDVPGRVITTGIPNETGQQRSLFPTEVLHVGAEIDFRRRLDPVGASPEINGVEISLENLVLGQLVLEPEGVERFGALAVDVLVRGEDGVFHQLLGDGGTALGDAAGVDVFDHRPERCSHVDTVVLVEIGVFHAQDGVDHWLGNVCQFHRLPALLVGKEGQECAVSSEHCRALIQDPQRQVNRATGVGSCDSSNLGYDNESGRRSHRRKRYEHQAKRRQPLDDPYHFQHRARVYSRCR